MQPANISLRLTISSTLSCSPSVFFTRAAAQSGLSPLMRSIGLLLLDWLGQVR